MRTCRDCGLAFDETTVPKANGRAPLRCRACLRTKRGEYKKHQHRRVPPLLQAVRAHAVQSETLGIWIRTLRSGEPER